VIAAFAAARITDDSPRADGAVKGLDNDIFIDLLTGYGSGTAVRVAYAWDAENRLVAVTPLAPVGGDSAAGVCV
jgi:YD repeat-containing protein